MFLALTRSNSCTAAMLALVLLATGCAKTGKVAGKVTLADGKPLPGGTITFTPVEGKGNPASAIIKEDGSYEVTAPTGMCKVTIDNRGVGKSVTPVGAGGITAPTDLPTKGPDSGGNAPNMPVGMPKKGFDTGPPQAEGGKEAIAKAMEGKQVQTGASVPVPGKEVPINSKYFSPETSGIEVQVKGGAQTLDFKLD